MNSDAHLEVQIKRLRDGSYSADLRLRGPDNLVPTELASQAAVPFSLEPLLNSSLDIQTYGRLLTAQLFAEEALRTGWARARAYASGAGHTLRVRLTLDPRASDLHGVRWEALHDLPGSTPLALQEKVVFSRVLASPELTPVPLPNRLDVRALVVVASPSNLSTYGRQPLDVAGEVARVTQAMGPIPVTVVGDHPAAVARRATLAAILEQLRGGPQIFYLVCHGTLVDGEPYLWLETEDGASDRIRGDALAARVRDLQVRPLLAVLASCQSAGLSHSGGALSAVGPWLAQGGVAAVLAMQDDLPVSTAGRLMPTFFRELHRDGQVDRALAAARAGLHGDPAWWVPVLFLRVSDGRLWKEVPDTPRLPRPAPSAHPPTPAPRPPARLAPVGRLGIPWELSSQPSPSHPATPPWSEALFNSLQELLGIHPIQLQAADEETSRVLLALTGRQTEGWLRERDIMALPCEALRRIDELWRTASDNRFGLGVQLQLWRGQATRLDKVTDHDLRVLGSAVGWFVDDQWLRQHDAPSDASAAPAGHFPSLRFPAFDQTDMLEDWQACLKLFLLRTNECLSADP